MRKEKIAIYIDDYSNLGGVERVTSNLISLLRNRYNVSTLLSLHKANELQMNYPSIKVYVLNTLNDGSITKILKKESITHLIIQIQNLTDSYKIASIAKNSGCKVIPILHSSPFYYLKKYGGFSQCFSSIRSTCQYVKMHLYWKRKHLRLFKCFVNHIGCVVCVSKKAAWELKQVLQMPVDDERVTHIYNPVSFSPSTNTLKKSNILLFAGRLDFEKQPMRMLKIWKDISYECPNWKFVILGDGVFRSRMQKFLDYNKLQNVNILGTVSNVDDYLKKSRITLLCSYYEGLPTVLLEASVYENALIAYDGDGGISDIVQNEVNGYLVELNNEELLKARLLYLMQNIEVCNEMGKNACHHLSNFNNGDILDRWQMFF